MSVQYGVTGKLKRLNMKDKARGFDLKTEVKMGDDMFYNSESLFFI